MKLIKLMIVVVAALMATSPMMLAEEGQDTDQATKAALKEQQKELKAQEKALKEVRFLPYKELKSLSDEQKSQIAEIHARYLAEKRKLEEQEDAEIRALLTAEQVSEVRQVEQRRMLERKEKAAERRSQMKQEAKEKLEKSAGEADD